tara:strand:+ start:98 stop:562 length:465 start_codon:yes stop_codon:yes gene_type:complete
MEKNCNKCGIKLVVGDNILSSRFKISDFKCITCNREYRRIRSRTVEMVDPIFKLKNNLRARVHRGTFVVKKWARNNMLCDILEVNTQREWLDYIENQFVDGMSWENYGEWELDHIIELHTARTKEDIYKLFHKTNYQPLWKQDNKDKSNKLRYD